jgi:hypothetical protein
MSKSFIIRTAIVAITFASLTAKADVVIDLFSDNQASQSVSNGTITNSATGPNIMGGERDIILTAGARVTVNSKAQFDELVIGSSAASTGSNADRTFTAEIHWDGVDTAVDKSGVNLTPGIFPATDFSKLDGFSASVNQSDGSGFFEVFIYNSALEVTSVLLPFEPVTSGSPVTFFIPFNFFSPVINLTDIIAVVLKLTATGNTDVNVGAIRAVPAPSILVLLSLGLLGLSGLACHKFN